MKPQKLVTLLLTNVAAGSELQFSTSEVLTPMIVITAPAANTGNMYVGDSTVTSANGLELPKGGAPVIIKAPVVNGHQQMFDLSKLYFDAATSGDKLRVAYLANA